MVKRKHTLVVRNTLAELEAAVRALQNSNIPWDLNREATSITVNDALDAIAKAEPVAVTMVRELTAEEYAMIQDHQPAGVQGDGTG